MIDVNILRNDPAAVEKMLADRGSTLDLDPFRALDARRRELITESDKLKSMRKQTSKQIGQLIGKGEDVTAIKAEVAEMGEKIKAFDSELAGIETELRDLLAAIPNMLDPTTPIGPDEDANVEVDRWGSPRDFDFEVKDHVDLGTALGILDLERAAKLTGARFALLYGDGARLERALINFMIDVHNEQGYTEVLPPFIVNSDSMYGTGQFPKMREDVFKLEGLDYYLIPTAEVPVTNVYRDEILDGARLPLRYQAFTPCFRSEAGSHGRDTRGLIRLHQFYKVELVKFVHPDTSVEALETLRRDAEEILRRLEIPYRVVALCSGDISFTAAKCYDLEAWLPGQGKYREISSCSNFGDFQARRAKIRFKSGKQKGLVHTLNGSGLAVGRTMVALVENHQQADGSILIPEALRPYMGGQTHIVKQK